MKHVYFAVSLLAMSSVALAADGPAVGLCEPWQAAYAGDDATGKHVIALWSFDGASPLEDASGHGHKLTLSGAALAADGRFGGCLESYMGYPVKDERHQAVAKNHPALSPPDAFTIEMWLKPKPELKDYPEAFLLDKKYVAPSDYQLILHSADKEGWRTVEGCLGFGNGSSSYHSRPMRLEAGQWHHLAFTYDGQGRGNFFLDGLPWGGGLVEGRRAISPGPHSLVIGDRIGSLYHGFPGFIDQVRLCTGVREFRPIKAELLPGRLVFLRREAATLKLAVTNLQKAALGEAEARVSLDGLGERRTALTGLAAGQAKMIDYPLDTSVRPGEYRLAVRLAVREPAAMESEESFRIRIVARPAGEQFPVVMWGGYTPQNQVQEMDRLKRIGFTHVLGLGADYERIWKAGQPTQAADDQAVAVARQGLDEALAGGITLCASLSPASHFVGKGQFDRVGRDGKPYAKDVCALAPELETFCYNVGASMARTYGDHPAFGAALLHTEVRDHAQPCFHPRDLEAFRKATGLDQPPDVNARWGAEYAKLKDFPADRVVPDDHPILRYCRWYWTAGDGWNGLNSALHRGLKSTGRSDLWTWHDPAVRVASVYGSGGQADVISQWTYSYPDPIRIGLATDELLAMAGGRAGRQQVMKMTQVIWYRSQTAPAPKTAADTLPYRAAWEIEQPDAPFITIAPMHLREAFWTKIARPIRGIMYHGWQSLVPCDGPGGYRFTNPQTQHELARLVREVVQPLGPTLLKTPPVRADVAMLESFASQMFARRGTYGWGGSWGGDAWHVLAYAHLQPEIVYDETVAARGLEGFRVLVLCDCDVLTASVVRRIREFQAKGGLVVGDERLCPAIQADIVLQSCQRTGQAEPDKAALLGLASELRKKLDGRYVRYADSTHPDVIPYRRRFADSDYVFLVNDRRELGAYVGQHGRVMENGLPAQATISLNRPAGFVYDLVAHQAVPARQEAGRLLVDLALGPCEGTLLLATGRAIEQVKVQCPPQVAPGKLEKLVVTVADSAGKPIDAVVPVEVVIQDSEGRPAEFSGFHAAVAGRLELPLDIAPNDAWGSWQVRVRDLAAGRTARAFFRVERPRDWPPSKAPAPGGANPVQPQG